MTHPPKSFRAHPRTLLAPFARPRRNGLRLTVDVLPARLRVGRINRKCNVPEEADANAKGRSCGRRPATQESDRLPSGDRTKPG